MKTKNIIKSLVLSFTLLVTTQAVFGQNSYINDRWNIKLGYARYQTGAIRNGEEKLKRSNFRIEGNYGLLDFLEGGIYLGMFDSKVFLINNEVIYSEDRAVVSYGFNANLHVLPFFIDAKVFKVDLYLVGRYGLRSMLDPPEDMKSNFFPEFGIGGGFAFYPWEHIGLFTESTYGKYEYNTNLKDRFIIRYGLSFKL